MKNALALIRTSTDKQDLKRQRTDIERLKQRFRLNIVRVLELHGVSGTSTLDNKQVQQLLREMQQSGIEGLACSAVDRIFRPKRYSTFGILDAFVDGRKLLWSVREGEVDPATDAGFDICINAGARAGSEWRELRRRVRGGKEEHRAAGLCPDANCIPRGVRFDRAAKTWSYEEPDCSRVAKMHELLLDGKSYRSVAEAVGGGWTYQGVRHAVKNRIWAFGTRTYQPVGERTEPLEVVVIEQPLISVAMYEAVQMELAGRKARWRKTKLPPRFLLAGLLTCACGKPWYVRCRSRYARSKQDYYFCSSHFRGRGPACGARSWQARWVEAAVERIVSQYLCEAAVLRAILATVAAREPPAEDARRQAEVARLEAKRARVLEQREDGLISREACAERVRALDQELQAARARVPSSPAAELDFKALAIGLAGAFALFAKQTFAEKRNLLERAVEDIALEGGVILGITLRGGFLGEILGANLSQRYFP